MAGTMKAPESGVKIRMYRQGHGDCYLLAFAGKKNGRKDSIYVLIDCGLKPGSEVHKQKINTIVDDIAEATGGHIHVVAITHEHQDHVNGFGKKIRGKHIFDKLTFDHCWLPWTEDETDETANALREKFRDTLITLAFAQEKVNALMGAKAEGLQERIADLLGSEIGDEGVAPAFLQEGASLVSAFTKAKQANPNLGAAAIAELAIKGVSNKKAMAYVRKKAKAGVTFLSPEDDPQPIPHADGIKAYTLGPPRDEALLLDLDPQGNEEFHLAPSGRNFALGEAGRAFAMAAAPAMRDHGDAHTFASQYRIGADEVLDADPPLPATDLPQTDEEQREVDAVTYLRSAYGRRDRDNNAPEDWRRIDDDWLSVSEGLALRLNNEVNNTSLVLAFELPNTGKVLLFTGDAQRGNWLGWADLKWDKDNGSTVTTRELLSRCVLYKVGHHGSHNATLNGTDRDDHANIGWMARGAFAEDFVAMIPANTEWAMGKRKPWRHPLPEIEAALHKKARGRVFRTDRDKIEKPDQELMSEGEWRAFKRRIKETRLYFDFTIEDR